MGLISKAFGSVAPRGFLKPLGDVVSNPTDINGGKVSKLNRMGERLISGASTFGATEINRKAEINPGGKRDALFGGAHKIQMAEATAAEQERLDQEAKNEQGLLDRADASYGVGLSPEALANASRMRARRMAATTGVEGAARREAEDDYSTGLSDTRATLARAGLIGSGVEGQARSDLLARYFGGITKAQQAGAVAGQQFDTQGNQARQAIRTGIRGGQITDTTGLRTEIGGLDAQGSNGALWTSAMGKFAPVAANNYANNRLARAYGGA